MKKPLKIKAWAVYRNGLFWVHRSKITAGLLSALFDDARVVRVEIKEIDRARIQRGRS